MRSVQVSKTKGPLEMLEKDIPEPGSRQVRIKVQACGICHGDSITKEGLFPGIEYPRTPGHEIAGIIDKVGNDVNEWKVGERVAVGWHGGHCGHCESCRRGDFLACSYAQVPGITYDGGYADYMVAPIEAIVSIPDELSFTEAAPLMCAGITTYNALRNSGARPGDVVAILGIGGLGHLGIQFASKMGLATAQRFVQEGAFVFISGRRQDELDKAVKQIGRNVMGVQGDVSNLADLDRLYETVKQQKGRIDILFANAGIIEVAPLGSITEALFDKLFNINVKGLLFTVQKPLPLFQDGGSIILTASIGGSKGFEGVSVYAATKAAIRSFARSWTIDLKNRKIRVNAVSPGAISTPMATSAGLGLSEEQVEALGRMGNPDEIASAVAFLASDDSTYITGIELFVDGGLAQI